jgi:hypothetical protein
MFRHRTTDVDERDADAGGVEHDDTSVDETNVVERDETFRRGRGWSPAQIVALAIGGAAIVFGVVALARTGLDTDNWYAPVESVLGFPHSPLLAICEIGFGVLMVFAAMSPTGRLLMAVLSAVALAFGIVIVSDAWASDIDRWFGVRDRNGWLFVIVGGVGLASALLLPTVRGRETREVHERRHLGQPTAAR